MAAKARWSAKTPIERRLYARYMSKFRHQKAVRHRAWLAGLKQGTRVFFQGQPAVFHGWKRGTEYLLHDGRLLRKASASDITSKAADYRAKPRKEKLP